MTMDFRVKDPALLRTLKPGQSIGFEFIEETAGEFAIVRVQPAAAQPSTGSKPAPTAKPATGPASVPRPAASDHKGH
jgi:Cu(I)/Ag(I) efflux system membrane fusion protein